MTRSRRRADAVNEETTVARGHQRAPQSGELLPFLLVVSGVSIGRAIRLGRRSCVIGRGGDADLILDDDGISRHHAKIIPFTNGILMIKDLESTNGTYVNDERIKTHPIENGDSIRLGAQTILKFTRADSIEEGMRRHLYDAATRDPLTSAYNKRYFDELLLRSVAFSRRHKQPLSVILLDLDHFKQVNDVHGHLVGDEALSQLVETLAGTIRTEDSLARIGGEEFCIVAPGIDLDHACLAAERLRKKVESLAVRTESLELSLTVSLGVAQFDPARHQSPEELVAEADECLYAAKTAGRNSVEPPPG